MKLLLAKDLRAYIGSVSSSQLKKLVAEGRFPAPIKLSQGGRLNAWVEAEVQSWIEQRIEAERGPKGRGKA